MYLHVHILSSLQWVLKIDITGMSYGLQWSLTGDTEFLILC